MPSFTTIPHTPVGVGRSNTYVINNDHNYIVSPPPVNYNTINMTNGGSTGITYYQ